MPAERVVAARNKRVPRWLVAAVVLCTAGVTVWAMTMTGMRGPEISWASARETVEEVWGEMPAAVPPSDFGAPAPGAPAAPPFDPAARPVAGFPTIPTIVAGAPSPHADRGACTTCHAIVSSRGAAIASIFSGSAMPHEYRGLCTNCHQIGVGPSAAGNLVAGTAVAPGPPPAPSPPATPRQPSEAEWLGLEVQPGANGVEVGSAEATARTAGLQRGDIVSSINGTPVLSMTDFVQVTQKGRLSHGTVIIARNGQRLAYELGQAALGTPPTVAAGANGVAPSGMGVAGTTPPMPGGQWGPPGQQF